MNREAASAAVDMMTGLLAVVAALMFVFVMSMSEAARQDAEEAREKGLRIAILTTKGPASTRFQLSHGADVATVLGEGVAVLRLTGDTTMDLQLDISQAAPGPRLAWMVPALEEAGREVGPIDDRLPAQFEDLAATVGQSEPAAISSGLSLLMNALDAKGGPAAGALRLKLGTIVATLREPCRPSFRIDTFEGPEHIRETGEVEVKQETWSFPIPSGFSKQ